MRLVLPMTRQRAPGERVTRCPTASHSRTRSPPRRSSSPNTHGDREYQHIVPEPWHEPGKGPGRFWGAFGLDRATATVEIGKDTYLTARRIIRRCLRSQRMGRRSLPNWREQSHTVVAGHHVVNGDGTLRLASLSDDLCIQTASTAIVWSVI